MYCNSTSLNPIPFVITEQSLIIPENELQKNTWGNPQLNSPTLARKSRKEPI